MTINTQGSGGSDGTALPGGAQPEKRTRSAHSPRLLPRDYAAAAAGARSVPGLDFPLSRRTDPLSVIPGARVIVRYTVEHVEQEPDGRRADHSGKESGLNNEGSLPSPPHPHGIRVTDVIGELLSIRPLVVLAQHTSTRVTIEPSRVVVLKTLSAAPVRTSDIRTVEQAIAAAFPGLSHQNIGGWLARAGDGITERSNSATPLSPEAGLQPVPLEALHEFYQHHGLPTKLLLPDRIGRIARGIPGKRGPEILVMTKDLAGRVVTENVLPSPSAHSNTAPEDMVPSSTMPQGHTAPERAELKHSALENLALGSARIHVRIDEQPDSEWLSMYHFRNTALPPRALELLRSRIDGQLGFARLSVDGRLAAITRATITTGGSRRWLGYSAVEVAPEFRRQGLGTLVGKAVMNWGVEQGADAAYLEVIESNTAGRKLYQKLGFSEHHRHRCLRVSRAT